MDIYKIIINGFKSFGDKTEFLIDKKITAIVGPNGSGKSNVTESIRFVLGEQSFKSIRGKEMTDFLFRGANKTVSRASVEIIFKRNLNENLQNLNSENQIAKNALEKEELSISRVVYGDGKNEYLLNGQAVRLKDIQEILLLIGIGNKQSWHISQGESDKILLAGKEDRKEIIEDALNLRIYHNRINEACRKLEMTKENIKQIVIQRKEIAPEINNLQKQVEKIERTDKLRIELEEKVSKYFYLKKMDLAKLNDENEKHRNLNDLENELFEIQKRIHLLDIELHKKNNNNKEILESEKAKEQSIQSYLLVEKNNLNNKILNLKNKISYFQIENEKSEEELEYILNQINATQSLQNDYIFSEADIRKTENIIDTIVPEILNGDISNADKIRLSYKEMLLRGSIVSKDNVKEISYLNSIKTRLTDKILKNNENLEINKTELIELENFLEQINLKLKLSNDKIINLQNQILEYKYEVSETEKEIELLKFKQREAEQNIINKKLSEQKILSFNTEFEKEKEEFKLLLGEVIYARILNNDEVQNNLNEDYFNLKKDIERLKIRLEEIGTVNREQVLSNHKALLDKDTFLAKEINDLTNSISNLENVITDLKTHLNNEFANGLENINISFDAYIKKLFGGGNGKVVEVKIENKKVEDEENTEMYEQKTGIEIEIELPKKKVKGLHSLSGGERALTSIALNFSILNQNKLPFMILDEADATLDEANAKRYGELLSLMSEKTKLIVVTHNRETMHYAEQMYGVTLSKEGASKVLSVSFADALQYAK